MSLDALLLIQLCLQEVTPLILVLLSQCALSCWRWCEEAGCYAASCKLLSPHQLYACWCCTQLLSAAALLLLQLDAPAAVCRGAWWRHYEHSCQPGQAYFTALLHKRASVQPTQEVTVQRFPGSRMGAQSAGHCPPAIWLPDTLFTCAALLAIGLMLVVPRLCSTVQDDASLIKAACAGRALQLMAARVAGGPLLVATSHLESPIPGDKGSAERRQQLQLVGRAAMKQAGMQSSPPHRLPPGPSA